MFVLKAGVNRYDYPLTRRVCETQMALVMTKYKDCKDHKNIYFDSGKKVLSQEMTMCNMEALIFIF